MDIQRLNEAALDARQRAYVPYSDFRMGAAVETDSGEVVQGVLVENVSLGLATCAERVAMFSTMTRGARPTALVLASERTGGKLTFPCGACLQVALELGGPDMIIGAVDLNGDSAHERLGDLLPRGPRKRSS